MTLHDTISSGFMLMTMFTAFLATTMILFVGGVLLLKRKSWTGFACTIVFSTLVVLLYATPSTVTYSFEHWSSYMLIFAFQAWLGATVHWSFTLWKIWQNDTFSKAIQFVVIFLMGCVFSDYVIASLAWDDKYFSAFLGWQTFMILLVPIFVVSTSIGWFLRHRFITDGVVREDAEPLDAYMLLRTLKPDTITASFWLDITQDHPFLMESPWWVKKGVAYWPDMMEWHAKMGTQGMIWLLRQGIDSPPEKLDDYSSSGPLWSFKVA